MASRLEQSLESLLTKFSTPDLETGILELQGGLNMISVGRGIQGTMPKELKEQLSPLKDIVKDHGFILVLFTGRDIEGIRTFFVKTYRDWATLERGYIQLSNQVGEYKYFHALVLPLARNIKPGNYIQSQYFLQALFLDRQNFVLDMHSKTIPVISQNYLDRVQTTSFIDRLSIYQEMHRYTLLIKGDTGIEAPQKLGDYYREKLIDDTTSDVAPSIDLRSETPVATEQDQVPTPVAVIEDKPKQDGSFDFYVLKAVESVKRDFDTQPYLLFPNLIRLTSELFKDVLGTKQERNGRMALNLVTEELGQQSEQENLILILTSLFDTSVTIHHEFKNGGLVTSIELPEIVIGDNEEILPVETVELKSFFKPSIVGDMGGLHSCLCRRFIVTVLSILKQDELHSIMYSNLLNFVKEDFILTWD